MKKSKNIQWVYWLLAMGTLTILWVALGSCEPQMPQRAEVTQDSGRLEQSGENTGYPMDFGELCKSPLEQGFFPEEVPAYAGSPYCQVNNNIPYFPLEAQTGEAWAYYSELDEAGRCGTTAAVLRRELMPVEERGLIGEVKPTGWQYAKYDFVEGRYLYNRCHLIGYQLTGENANERNLITGTRYLNVEGMLPFENQVAEYVRRGGGVLYRVTPIFWEDNSLAMGILMEAWSEEDAGESICFNIFCYNVQPGVEIDYATGRSKLYERYPDGDTD